MIMLMIYWSHQFKDSQEYILAIAITPVLYEINPSVKKLKKDSTYKDIFTLAHSLIIKEFLLFSKVDLESLSTQKQSM